MASLMKEDVESNPAAETIRFDEHLETVRALEDKIAVLIGVIADLTLGRILGPGAATLIG